MNNKWQIRESDPDWQCDFEGNTRFQLQYFKSLPIEEKFKAVEDMCEVVDFFKKRAEIRKKT